ncbi:hypothetical protein SCLCIDRAFT_1209904 [Scleroderma citrinum Foug A]|uniref:Uncharacterized protein n=1 Tax=Scleroderma citrinum Foug A TaxID=1036808 RepID=A0A0C3EHM1_9AGAM|nr:hypothetical protein SCLCIDRAFT_1209904 [Scleroderma citrinum Foug A]
MMKAWIIHFSNRVPSHSSRLRTRCQPMCVPPTLMSSQPSAFAAFPKIRESYLSKRVELKSCILSSATECG